MKCRSIVVKGQQRNGRPQKTYQVVDSDRSLKIDHDLAQNGAELLEDSHLETCSTHASMENNFVFKM